MDHQNLTLILASSSSYRQALLQQIVKSFDQFSPDIDESRRENEQPDELALRLATEKALAVARDHKNSLIIASDQVAVCGAQILGKPGTYENALAQLKLCSGQTVTFLTSLCLYNAVTGEYQLDLDRTVVKFRLLNDQEISAYIEAEQPLDCAGSFKVEGLGIALFEAVKTDDPSALVGLPLIKLTSMLRAEGINPLLLKNPI